MKKTFWNKLTARGTRGKTRCAAAVLALAMTFSMGAPLALAAQPEESTAAVTETVSAQQETAMPTLQTETPELAAQDPEAPPVQATEAEENSTNQHTPENSVVLTPEEIREAYYLKEYQTDGARIAVCSTNPNFDENILDMTDIYKREMIVELKD